MPREERLTKIHRKWAFRCNCIACDQSTAFGEASEKRRQRMQTLFHTVKRYFNTSRDPEDLAFHKDLGYGNLDKIAEVSIVKFLS